MKTPKIIIQNGFEYHIYNFTDDAWNALTPSKLKQGWRIGCYGGYENCIYRQRETNKEELMITS